MDQVTQQNAALVEEMAAAASSLKSQAQELVQTVSVFKLGAQSAQAASGMPTLAVRSPVPKNLPYKGSERRATPRTAAARAAPVPAAPAARPGATKPAPVVAPGSHDADWETF